MDLNVCILHCAHLLYAHCTETLVALLDTGRLASCVAGMSVATFAVAQGLLPVREVINVFEAHRHSRPSP
jgi:hypothetical protein